MLREARIGRSIADALLPLLAVAIEVDGGVHDAFRADHDAQRRRYLEERDITVLMFSNADRLAGPEVLTGRLRPYLKKQSKSLQRSKQPMQIDGQSISYEPIILFTFEPGDGLSYRILFGRMRCESMVIPYYMLFGIAIGPVDPGAWFAFHRPNPTFDIFARHLAGQSQPTMIDDQTLLTAWRVYRACMGLDDDHWSAAQLPAWRADWTAQIPPLNEDC